TKQERIVRAKGRAWFGDDKTAYRFNGTLQDITEQVIARQKIETSEKRFSNILSQSIMAIGILDGVDMVVTFANDSLLAMWGKEKSIIGKPLLEVMAEIKGQGFPELLAEVYNTGVPYEAFEAKAAIMHNGILVDAYFNFVYQPYRDIDNTITGITLFATEVTEQVLAKKQIEASEKRFSKMVHQSPFAFAILKGKDMVISLANGTIKELWGKGKEVEGKRLFDLLPELKESVFPKLFDDVFTTGIPHLENEILARLEHNGVLKDMYFNQVYQPFYDADDTIFGVTIIAVEVTSQVLAKKQMEESENQFRTFADSIQNLAWIANSDGWRYWYNQQWYNYTGSTKEEMEGWGWEKVHHPDHIKNVSTVVKESLKKDEAFELTFPLRRHDGEYRWFLTRAFPVKDTSGNIDRWIGTNTDITQQKMIEQRKDEFISIASHEMKTPLTTAKGYIELLMLSLSEENETVLYATKAKQAVSRLHDLVTELLDASKIQNGQLDYTITTFDFNNMVDETIENFQHSAKNHSLQKTGNCLQPITGDRGRLQQVLINLLSNAVKYSPKADKVLVKIEQLDNRIQVSVQDFGVGMSAKHLDKVFDRYYRVQEHAVHFQGLGIGLYISNNIIQRHEGKMWVESEPGKGSKFYFSLPI
ncbi:MAG: PAS domain S-box protein, partial [Ginsengibacter sp.]